MNPPKPLIVLSTLLCLQNADDAKAETVAFCLDRRTHASGVSRTGTLSIPMLLKARCTLRLGRPGAPAMSCGVCASLARRRREQEYPVLKRLVSFAPIVRARYSSIPAACGLPRACSAGVQRCSLLRG